jgi:hypothetical protein
MSTSDDESVCSTPTSTPFDAFKECYWFRYSQSSEFRDLLKHNDLPSPLATSDIREALKQAKEQLFCMKTDIPFGSANAEEGVEAIIAEYETVLAPIRLLPYDILEYISAFSPRRSLRHSSGATLSNGPWPLGHVSRKWRGAVVGSARLWHDIRLTIDPQHATYYDDADDSDDFPPSLLEMLGDYDAFEAELQFYLNEGFRRSRQTPLSITFYCLDPVVAQKAFSLFMPYSTRWRSLSLSVSPQLSDTLSSIQNHLGALEDLEISIDRLDLPVDFISAFERANLQCLRLVFSIEEPLVFFPWQGLKTLVIRSQSVRVLLSVVQSAPALESMTCRFTAVPYFHSPNWTGGIVEHKHLRILSHAPTKPSSI